MAEWLLHRHLRPQHPRGALAPRIERADLAGENAAAVVKLQRHLARVDTELVGRVLIKDLLDFLKLQEVRARPDGPEAQPAHLDDEPGRVLPGLLAPAEGLDVEPAALLDPVKLGRAQVVPLGGEVRALRRRAQHLAIGQIPAPGRRIGEQLGDLPVEIGDRGRGRPVDVQGQQRHAAVQRGMAMSRVSSAIPQFSAASVRVGRIAPLVATAMLDGISDFSLWQKSGSTTGGAARSVPSVPTPRRSIRPSSAGAAWLSNTVNGPPRTSRDAVPVRTSISIAFPSGGTRSASQDRERPADLLDVGV